MICNMLWGKCFPVSSVTHLLCMRSDYRSLILRVGHAHQSHLPRNFKYFTGWQHHVNFERMVQDKWKSGSSLAATISNFTDQPLFGIKAFLIKMSNYGAKISG
ncbi:hypothetical protein GQ457_13G021140 [Hibiscus cannabinus]